ncbi:MAG: GDP-mannose 4,6-dehydratase [Pseudomonadota bacterium]
MKTALITGITGQDGGYMAELLLKKGYRVVGAVRDPIDATQRLLPTLSGHIELVKWDMHSSSAMSQVLASVKPTEFYNFAAYSSGAGMYDDPVGMIEVNGLAVVRTLEAIRLVDGGIRFCQASSREVFGEALESPQSELTQRHPRSPYGAAKSLADTMIEIYRQRHGIFASSAILFNHESPRRGMSFVTRKITYEAARIKRGLARELYLGNLDAQRDWGFAGDYVQAMWLMLQQSSPGDFVVCTGKAHSVRDFCEYAFGHLDLDYKNYVKEDEASFRRAEPVLLVGSALKAERELGWFPEIGFRKLVEDMVDSDLRLVSAVEI